MYYLRVVGRGMRLVHAHAHARKNMARLTQKLGVFKPTDKTPRLKALDFMFRCPGELAGHEIDYISKRIPVSGKNLGIVAVEWSVRFGHKERMCEVVKENGDIASRVSFAWLNKSFRPEIKKTVGTAEGAFCWAEKFPEDREDMKEKIGGGEWAFKWAKSIGDEKEMKERIQIPFWKRKFEMEIEGKSKKFVHEHS